MYTINTDSFISRPNAKKIGLISDTHVPDRAKSLPEDIKKYFKDVDLILHAGDITTPNVLRQLGDYAECIAVRGNNGGDKRLFNPPLPRIRTVELAYGFRMRMYHGVDNFIQRVMDNMVGRIGFFPVASKMVFKRVIRHSEGMNCVLFGHCHWPFLKKYKDVIYINPGRGFQKTESGCAKLYLMKHSLEVQFFPLGKTGCLDSLFNQTYKFTWQ